MHHKSEAKLGIANASLSSNYTYSIAVAKAIRTSISHLPENACVLLAWM